MVCYFLALLLAHCVDDGGEVVWLSEYVRELVGSLFVLCGDDGVAEVNASGG